MPPEKHIFLTVVEISGGGAGLLVRLDSMRDAGQVRGINVTPPPSVAVTLFFKHHSKGETEPIADNNTEEGEKQNRRVVFVRK